MVPLERFPRKRLVGSPGRRNEGGNAERRRELGNRSSRTKMAFLIRHFQDRATDANAEMEADSNDPRIEKGRIGSAI